MRLLALAATAAIVLAGCSAAGQGEGSPSGDAAQLDSASGTAGSTATGAPGVEGTREPSRDSSEPAEPAGPQDPADRSYVVEVPASYDPGEPVPLVLVLHGYASSGDGMRRYLGVDDLAEERGFLVVHPDGSVDARGNGFWDATDGCCNFAGTPTGDDEFLARIITEVSAEYAVDPGQVHVVGYSNGGFMAYRMACRHADLVASVASLSGATFADPSDCDPSEPVSVLQVHGDADRTIRYEGGTIPGPYPGAADTVTTWAGYNGCDTSAVPGEPRDLDEQGPGAESTATTFPGCPEGVAVELWTVPGAGHLVRVSAGFPVDVIDWLLDHPDEP